MDTELILSAVVAIATVAYTIVNILMYCESRATRNQKLKPEIVPFLKSTASHDILGLYVKNVGEGCAKNVRIRLLDDYSCFGKADFPLSKFPLFSEGVNVFPSGYELHYYIDSWKNLHDKGHDGYLEMEISFTDIKGKQFDRNYYKLKFSQIMSNYSTPPDTTEEQIAYYLKQISKSLEKQNK